MSGRHDWNSWGEYQNAHFGFLRAYEHFVLDDQCRPILLEHSVEWTGILYCVDGIEIHVDKTQEVDHRNDRPMVRTVRYKYHVLQRRGRAVRNLFRYDNVGDHGLREAHHRHEYGDSNQEIGSPAPILGDQWPTLGEVIQEAHRWWEERQGH